jgi:hypothetical protein
MRGRLGVRVDNTAAHLEQLTLHLSGSTRSGGARAGLEIGSSEKTSERATVRCMCRGSQKEPDCCHSPCSNSEQIIFRVSRPSAAGCGSGGRACPGQPLRRPSAAAFRVAAAAAAGCGSGGRACPGQPSAAPPPPSPPPPPPDAAAGGALGPVIPAAAPPPPPSPPPPPPDAAAGGGAGGLGPAAGGGSRAGSAGGVVAWPEGGEGGGVNRSKKISNDEASRKKIELKHHQHTVTLQTDSHPHDAKTQNL